MSRNGSGTYTLPANTVSPASTGTTISSTDFNEVMDDIESALTQSVSKDGQTVLTGTLDHNGNEIILDVDGDTSITADTDDQIDFKLFGVDTVRFKTVTSAVNGIDVTAAATGNQPYIQAQGSDSNFGVDLRDSNGNEILITDGVASAVNEVKITNAATTANPIIQSSGEANTGLILADSNGNEVTILESTASAVNEITVTNAATGSGPIISATGTDTNIDINLTPKGDGSVVISTTSTTTISGAAASTITVSGLDSTYTDGYIVDGIIIGATNGTLDLVLDSDTTATNYYKVLVDLDGTYSNTSANDNILNTIAGSPRNYPFSFTIVQDTTTGQVEAFGTIGDTRGLGRIIQFVVTYTVTDNITSIGFAAGAAAIDIGSFMRVRRVI